MLDMLKEQKQQTIVAIEKAKQAEQEYNAYSETPYPENGTIEERIAYSEKYEKLSDAKKAAYSAASRRIVSLGEFLGVKINKKSFDWSWQLDHAYGDLDYYLGEVERKLKNVIDDYNQFR